MLDRDDGRRPSEFSREGVDFKTTSRTTTTLQEKYKLINHEWKLTNNVGLNQIFLNNNPVSLFPFWVST